VQEIPKSLTYSNILFKGTIARKMIGSKQTGLGRRLIYGADDENKKGFAAEILQTL